MHTWIPRVELAQCEGHPREYSLAHLSVIRPSDKSYCKRQKGEETKLALQAANMSSSLALKRKRNKV